MREKMIKDISAAASCDPDAMNIKKALKLKDELNAQVCGLCLFRLPHHTHSLIQASIVSAHGFCEVISILLCEDERLSSIVVGHDGLWDVIDKSDVLIRPVLSRMGAAVK
jgi:hypothetical protein